MASVKPYPPIINKHFQDIFETVFPALKTPAKDTEEDKQEYRNKPKKRRDDE